MRLRLRLCSNTIRIPEVNLCRDAAVSVMSLPRHVPIGMSSRCHTSNVSFTALASASPSSAAVLRDLRGFAKAL